VARLLLTKAHQNRIGTSRMKLIQSTQVNLPFVMIKSPVTVDKSGEWGEGNLQLGPNGGFLKLSDPITVSHLVQPKPDWSAPIGWRPGSKPGLFTKDPIWIDEKNVLQPGTKHSMTTADGPIEYNVQEPSVVCYNDLDGKPNLNDGWVQKLSVLGKNYVLQPKRKFLFF
jgi:hypothetical protein